MSILGSDSPNARPILGSETAHPSSPDRERELRFSDLLLSWYDTHKRDLPWRRTRDPYRIWVSEIMLQQTRVEAVIPYYERFLERFPTPGALAGASEEEVLAQWSGLGYYSRARNLWRGAALVCERFGGEFPLDRDAALQLPGIGRYTSAAIVSIAADLPHAVVDGNVARVLARLFALEPPADRSIPKLEVLAQKLLSPTRAGDHNQAMMELGATVCTPRAPRCDRCPVRSRCAMIPNKDPEAYPRALPRKETVALELVVLLLRDSRGRLLLERGRWTLIPHLWLPPVLASPGPNRGREAIGLWPSLASDRTRIEEVEPLGFFRHSITHHRIRFAAWGGRISHAPADGDHRLANDTELGSTGLSSVALKALRLEGKRRS